MTFRRTGQIERSRAQYDDARRHLSGAYGGAPEQRAANDICRLTISR